MQEFIVTCGRSVCIDVQAEHKCEGLLQHPLVVTMLNEKWFQFGAQLYVWNLLLYVLQVLFLTTFSLSLPHPLSPSCETTPTPATTHPLPTVWLVNLRYTYAARAQYLVSVCVGVCKCVCVCVCVCVCLLLLISQLCIKHNMLMASASHGNQKSVFLSLFCCEDGCFVSVQSTI